MQNQKDFFFFQCFNWLWQPVLMLGKVTNLQPSLAFKTPLDTHYIIWKMPASQVANCCTFPSLICLRYSCSSRNMRCTQTWELMNSPSLPFLVCCSSHLSYWRCDWRSWFNQKECVHRSVLCSQKREGCRWGAELTTYIMDERDYSLEKERRPNASGLGMCMHATCRRQSELSRKWPNEWGRRNRGVQ